MPPTIMPDDQPLDLGELELPIEAASHLVEDEFAEPCGARFSFLGLGRGGIRIAEAFYRLGYARVAAVSDDPEDGAPSAFRRIRVPPPASAEQSYGLRGLDETIGKGLVQAWGEWSDVGFLCIAAGDPLAASAGPAILRLMRKALDRTPTIRKPRLGAIVALPSLAEGASASKAALLTLKRLTAKSPTGTAAPSLSPLILLDNEHIGRVFGNESLNALRAASLGAARILHLFNRQAVEPEPERFAGFWEMLDSGSLYLGAQIVRKPMEPNALNSALVWELNANLFCPAPLSKARQAAVLLLAGEGDARGLSEKTLKRAFDALARRMGPNPKIHRLIGASQGPGLLAASLIGDCPLPADRLFDMAELAGANREMVAEMLGIDPREAPWLIDDPDV